MRTAKAAVARHRRLRLKRTFAHGGTSSNSCNERGRRQPTSKMILCVGTAMVARKVRMFYGLQSRCSYAYCRLRSLFLACRLDDGDHPVFGAPLHESLRYASVQISTANPNGELYVWGDIPVVVAKCGLYLKENGADSNFCLSILRCSYIASLEPWQPLRPRALSESAGQTNVCGNCRHYLKRHPESAA